MEMLCSNISSIVSKMYGTSFMFMMSFWDSSLFRKVHLILYTKSLISKIAITMLLTFITLLSEISFFNFHAVGFEFRARIYGCYSFI